MDKNTQAEAQRMINAFADNWNAATSPNRLVQKGHRLSQTQLKRKPRRTYRIRDAFLKLKHDEQDKAAWLDYKASIGWRGRDDA
jgi:hypothetical protein